MFEQSFLAGPARTRRAWTVAVSFCGQTALIALAAVMPLIFFDNLPGVRAMMRAPEAPPPPAKRPAGNAVKIVDVKYVARPGPVTAPFRIPDTVAKITDIAAPPALELAADWGVIGGTGIPREPGVTAHIVKAVAEGTPRPAAAPAAAPAAVKPAEPVPPRIRIGSILPANLIRRVVPEYPALAHQARIEGTVRLQAVIGRDGTIQQLEFVSGPALLVKAAMDAVSRWLYRPTILNGEPVEVITTIDVNFVLGR